MKVLRLLILCSGACIAMAHAMVPEERWQVVGQPPTFATKAAAVAHMQSLTSIDPRYALLTIEKHISAVSDSTEQYRYEAPKIAPDTTAWNYLNPNIGGGNFATEAEAVAHTLANTNSASQCDPPFATPTSEWLPFQFGWGGVSYNENRTYVIHFYTYSQQQCQEVTSNTHLQRTRMVVCPSGYSGETAAPGCFIPLTAQIAGRLTYGACPANRGNSCNAVTGDKSETIDDYKGPYDLRLTRYYHSRGLDSTGRMGPGWSHNYQSRLIYNSAGQLLGLSRAGLRESVQTLTTPTTHYIAKGGSGIVIKKISSSLWHAFLPDGTMESYDGSGALTAIRDPAGRTTTLSYAGEQLLSVTGPFGHALQFEYDTEGRLHQVALSSSDVIVYEYSGANLTSVLYPDGSTRTYHYENAGLPNHLTGITDESGVRLSTFSYDAVGRPILTERSGGVERYTFVYNAGNSVVTDPLGTTETISFTTDTSLQRRITALSKAGQTRSYIVPSAATDPQRRPTQETDPRGTITQYAYSGYALTSKTEALGTPLERLTTYTYLNNDSDLPTLITEPGRSIAYTYDGNNNVLTRTITDTSATPQISRLWSWTYDGAGRVLTANGPRTDVSDVTTYTYYSCTTGFQCGQIETITNAAGHVTTYNTYNAHGQPLTITDPNGLVTTLTYDLRQRLTSRTVGSEQTTFDYWHTGLLKKATLPDGSFLEYTYDGARRLTEIEDSEGNRIVYTLDAMGNRVEEEVFDPLSALTQTRTRVFNTLNQLWKDLGAAGTAAVTTTFAYDNNGNQTNINAPLARNTVQAYDELDRLKQVTDPLSGLTLYGYDALDQLISVTDPRSKVTTYSYNALGDLKEQVSPDTGTTVNTYDSGGNLATSTDARSKTGTYGYDALNRVTSLTYPDQTITYTYDTGTNQNGRLTQVSDASGSTAWSYDTHGRVLTKQQTMGSVSKTVGYAYDSFGRLQTLTLPSGNTITYGYTDGKVTSLTLNGSTTILSNVLYQPFGPTAGWTWGNGTFAVREYDTDGKITDIDSAGLKTYSYDDAFRITGITDATDPNLSQSYGYDLLDQLTSATGTSLNQGWTYDANGNRLTQTGSDPSTYTISGTNNRITNITGSLTRTYGYDDAGSTTSDGAATFTYNDAGRMVSATKASVTTTYSLNALGQRVRKSASGTSTYFAYDEVGHLVGEYGNSGNLVQETIWMADTPVATLRPNGGSGVNHFYVHTDQLDTPRRISRPSDNVIVWRWDADPFGTAAANEDPDSDTQLFAFNLRFPGQYLDSETSLHYNYFRDYDPQIGRYGQSDPIGLEGGINTFAYVGGNPINDFDLFGLSGETERIPGGNPTTVRIDKPHVPGQQTHAHVCEKGCKEVVVNKDGTGSHGTDPKKLRNKVKDFLRKRGFKLIVCPPFLEDIVRLRAAEECLAGDPISCRIFQDLGGTIEGPIA